MGGLMLEDMFQVYWQGEWPNKKRIWYSGLFGKRQQARKWCRTRQYKYDGLVIVHPDGTEEPYTYGEWHGDEKQEA